MVQFVLPGKPSASGLDVKYLKVLKEEGESAPLDGSASLLWQIAIKYARHEVLGVVYNHMIEIE